MFDNNTLIKLLKNRGACIASGKHKKIKIHDDRIDKFFNGAAKGKEEVQKILGAFIIFKTEDGYNEALRYIENPDFLKAEQKMLLGSKLKMEDADEPGNIIWESKHIKGFNLFKRIMLGLGLIAIMLIISFSVIVSLQIKSVRLD